MLVDCHLAVSVDILQEFDVRSSVPCSRGQYSLSLFRIEGFHVFNEYDADSDIIFSALFFQLVTTWMLSAVEYLCLNPGCYPGWFSMSVFPRPFVSSFLSIFQMFDSRYIGT